MQSKNSDMRMYKHCKKPLSQAGKEMNFAARNVKISLMSTNQEKRKMGTIKMIENRNVNIITDANSKKLVLINDILLKAKVRDDWTPIEEYIFRQIFPMNIQVQKAVLP